MSELIDWLKAQFDEDERMLERLTASFMHGFETNDEEPWGHFTDERRLRADIAAKRHILDLHDRYGDLLNTALREGRAPNVLDAEAKSQLERIVRLLAAAYRHRPGHQEAWRP